MLNIEYCDMAPKLDHAFDREAQLSDRNDTAAAPVSPGQIIRPEGYQVATPTNGTIMLIA